MKALALCWTKFCYSLTQFQNYVVHADQKPETLDYIIRIFCSENNVKDE